MFKSYNEFDHDEIPVKRNDIQIGTCVTKDGITTYTIYDEFKDDITNLLNSPISISSKIKTKDDKLFNISTPNNVEILNKCFDSERKS